MARHEKNERGFMGAAIVIVLGIFLALHFLFPAATLWPYALISLVLATMFASHQGRARRAVSESAGRISGNCRRQ